MDSPLTRYNDTDINAPDDFACTGMNRNFKFLSGTEDYSHFPWKVRLISSLPNRDLIFQNVDVVFWKLIEILITFNNIDIYVWFSWIFLYMMIILYSCLFE